MFEFGLGGLCMVFGQLWVGLCGFGGHWMASVEVMQLQMTLASLGWVWVASVGNMDSRDFRWLRIASGSIGPVDLGRFGWCGAAFGRFGWVWAPLIGFRR